MRVCHFLLGSQFLKVCLSKKVTTMKNPTKRLIIKKPSKTSVLSEKSLHAKDPTNNMIKPRAMAILSLRVINYL